MTLCATDSYFTIRILGIRANSINVDKLTHNCQMRWMTKIFLFYVCILFSFYITQGEQQTSKNIHRPNKMGNNTVPITITITKNHYVSGSLTMSQKISCSTNSSEEIFWKSVEGQKSRKAFLPSHSLTTFLKKREYWVPLLLGPNPYCSPHDRPINWETCWGKEQRLYSKSQQT